MTPLPDSWLLTPGSEFGPDAGGAGPVPCFAAASLCVSLAAAQGESGGKQKHYGCLSVSYSGNTVSQLKHNDRKHSPSRVCSARGHSGGVSGTGPGG